MIELARRLARVLHRGQDAVERPRLVKRPALGVRVRGIVDQLILESDRINVRLPATRNQTPIEKLARQRKLDTSLKLRGRPRLTDEHRKRLHAILDPGIPAR